MVGSPRIAPDRSRGARSEAGLYHAVNPTKKRPPPPAGHPTSCSGGWP